MDEGQVGEFLPQPCSGCGYPKQLLTLIDLIRYLLDETLADQRRNDGAQCGAFDFEHAQQIALHDCPTLGQLVQHVPLRGPQIVRTKGGLHDDAAREVTPLRPGGERRILQSI